MCKITGCENIALAWLRTFPLREVKVEFGCAPIALHDGNCASVVPASFGYDTITSCKYKLQKEETNNCTLLSESMADFVSSLISGEHAGKRGDLKFESLADVVPILWSGVDDNSSEQVGGCVVASGISIKVLFSEHLLASGVKLSRLVGLRIDPLAFNLSMPAPSALFVSSSLKFLRVNSFTERSKFWLRMMEHSENSWLEMLDPFLTVFNNEDNMQEIIIFWSVSIASAILIYGNAKFGSRS
ncbi:Hypothetical predicted protein [Cloeon dipterum]|uniref:Tectonic-1-3 domain-containing protein n=1 Tax=Cloeon dipterum TaxID=197152 RepID=A0A8S1CIZ7_9INSE|nr:Hypothetical predicted protein [Cloeon dipterum]